MTNFYYLNKFNIGGTSFLNSSSEFSTNNVVSNILSQNAYDASKQLQFISSNNDDNDNNGFDSFYSQYANIIGSDILSYTNQYVTTNDLALGDLVNNQGHINNLVADKTQFYFYKTADGDLYRYTSSNADNILNIDNLGVSDFDDLLYGYESYAKYIQDKLEGNPEATLDSVFYGANLQALGIDYNSIAIGKTQDEIKAIYQNLIDQIISEAKAIKPSTISKDDRIALEKDLETKEEELSTLDNLLLGTTTSDTTYTFDQYKIDINNTDANIVYDRYYQDQLNAILDIAQINDKHTYTYKDIDAIEDVLTTSNNFYSPIYLPGAPTSSFTIESELIKGEKDAWIPQTYDNLPAEYNVIYNAGTSSAPFYYFKSREDLQLLDHTSQWTVETYLKALNVDFYKKTADGKYEKCKLAPKRPTNSQCSVIDYEDLFQNDDSGRLKAIKEYNKTIKTVSVPSNTITGFKELDTNSNNSIDEAERTNRINNSTYLALNLNYNNKTIYISLDKISIATMNKLISYNLDKLTEYFSNITNLKTLGLDGTDIIIKDTKNNNVTTGRVDTNLATLIKEDSNDIPTKTVTNMDGTIIYYCYEQEDATLLENFLNDNSTLNSFENYLKLQSINFYKKEDNTYTLCKLTPADLGDTEKEKFFFVTSTDGQYIFTDRQQQEKYEKHIGTLNFATGEPGDDFYPITAYTFDGTSVAKLVINQETNSTIQIDQTNLQNLVDSINNGTISAKTIIGGVNNAENTSNIKNTIKDMEEELTAIRNNEATNWIKNFIQNQASFSSVSLNVESLKSHYADLSSASNEMVENIITTIEYLNGIYKNKIEAEIEAEGVSFSCSSSSYYSDIINELNTNNNYAKTYSIQQKNVIAQEVLKNVKLSIAQKLVLDKNYGATEVNEDNETAYTNLTTNGTISKLDNNISITTNLISGIKVQEEAYNTGLLKVNTKELKEYLISKMNNDVNAESVVDTIITNLEAKKIGNKIDNDIYIDIELYSDLANTKSPKQWMTQFLSEQINNLDESFNKEGNILQSMGNNDLISQIITDSEFDSSFNILDNSSFIKSHNIREGKFDIITTLDDNSDNDRTFDKSTGYNNYLTFDVELPANGYLNKDIKDKNDNIIVPAGLLTKTYRLSATVLDNNGNYISGPRLDEGTVLPIGTKKFEKSSLLSKLTTLLTSYVSGGDSDGDIAAASYVAKASMGIIENYLAENFNSQNPETVETYFYREFRELFNPNNKEGIIDIVINKEGTTEPQVIKMDFQLSGGILNAILSSQTFLEIGSKLEDRTRKEMELFESATALDIVQNINTQEYIYRLNILAGLEKINEEQGLGLDFSMVNKTLVSLGAGSSSNPWWQEYFPWFKGFYGNIPEGATAEDMFDENGNLTGLGQVGGMTIDPYILKINGVDYVLGKDNNQDGKINDATEILGIEDKIEDNFASLEALDIDKDGYISNEELKKGNIILQAVNQNERLNGASMSIDFVNGISLSSLKKENGTNNIYGTFSADMKNGSTVSGIQTFEQENYFHNLFGTYTDLSFLNKAETTTENQETTEEKTEETQIKYMAGVFSKKFSFLSNVESNSTEISVDKLIEDISWKLSIDNLSASQRYDIIDDIDITRSEDVITTEIENKLEQIKFSA